MQYSKVSKLTLYSNFCLLILTYKNGYFKCGHFMSSTEHEGKWYTLKCQLVVHGVYQLFSGLQVLIEKEVFVSSNWITVKDLTRVALRILIDFHLIPFESNRVHLYQFELVWFHLNRICTIDLVR